jgi:uncharacterized RDD family membrane protein YckC
MSHYGTPPPDDPEHQPDQPPDQPERRPGAHAAEPPPYNPYPDNWGSPASRSKPFVAGSGDQAPAGQNPPPAGGYGQLNPYAAAQGDPYATNPYAGSPSPDKQTFGFGGYAGWFTRVGAYVIDYILNLVAGFPAIIAEIMVISSRTTTLQPDGTERVEFHRTATSGLLLLIGSLMSLGFYIWNVYIRQGRTGATYGKSVLAIRLVNSDSQPIGPGWAFLRSVLHILDALPCCIGYLWPIWDSQKQTFADKIMSTYVIQATTPQPRVY